MLMGMSLVFIVLAIGLSWPRFRLIFLAQSNAALAAAPLTMVASAVNLCAIGLAVAEHGLLFGGLLIAGGMFFAKIMQAVPSTPGILASALCLAAYIEMTMTVVA
ncbi:MULTISPECIES: hypothetical protein [Ensifer]|jgi:hypothetical protein|nr:hypothetical protein [Ensifer sp. SL37]MCY1739645.1 hypothetical protein [Ensifer sp. SL37]OKP76428.1 hypothetical protein BTE77_16610 [Ensifer adhaerens]